MQDFRNLKVWQKAHELALLTYHLTADFPREETFGLRHSMRKTSVDIPAYIAEGCGKTNDAEFGRSISAAFGFASRLEYYALMECDLEMLAESVHKDHQQKVVEVKKMLSGFNQRLAHAFGEP